MPNNNETYRALFTAMRDYCNRKADRVQYECQENDCENGMILTGAGNTGWTPCPTCQPQAQALRDKAEKWCWHTVSDAWWNDGKWNFGKLPHCMTETFEVCTICHQPDADNPTPTVESLRAALEDMGEWERFVCYLWDKLNDRPSGMQYHEDPWHEKFADILTKHEDGVPRFLASAITSYLGRE